MATFCLKRLEYQTNNVIILIIWEDKGRYRNGRVALTAMATFTLQQLLFLLFGRHLPVDVKSPPLIENC